MRPFRILLLCLTTLTPPLIAQTNPPTPLEQELRTKDELLLNAVHRGDRKTWADLTTPDFLYIEDGLITDRTELLKDLEEDGNTPLLIRSYKVHQIGDTAMVLHTDDVPARPLRDTSKMHFLFSETWQKVDGHWMLRLVDINRLRVDPPSIALTHAQIDELVGTYHAGTKTLTIRRDGDRILATLPNTPETEWKAETRDVLFEPGDLLTHKVFQRDTTGKVIAMANRDQASDVIWTRQ